MKAHIFKNIIFDLGGVIINLDERRTIESFAQLSQQTFDSINEQILTFEEYHLLEKGLISNQDFRDVVRKKFSIDAPDEEIDAAMNAMLLDIPPERIELLKSLNNYSLFLLSNTNAIHFSYFNQVVCKLTGEENIDAYFNKAYYSHKVHMRKPDREIFELVIAENNLMPGETLFLDDNKINLDGAESVGIKTFHVKNPSQLFELFS